MKMDKNKTLMTLAMVSIVLCACPGCLLLIPGTTALADSLGDVQDFGDLLDNVWLGLSMGGWMICVGGLLILVPFILVSIALMTKNKPDEITPIEPTRVSEMDPIPPPS